MLFFIGLKGEILSGYIITMNARFERFFYLTRVFVLHGHNNLHVTPSAGCSTIIRLITPNNCVYFVVAIKTSTFFIQKPKTLLSSPNCDTIENYHRETGPLSQSSRDIQFLGLIQIFGGAYCRHLVRPSVCPPLLAL